MSEIRLDLTSFLTNLGHLKIVLCIKFIDLWYTTLLFVKRNAHILHTPKALITLLEIEQYLVQISWMKPECIGLYFY